MKHFSHRGNINGINDKENSPHYIDNALNSWFDVEIDLRLLGEDLYFGHDYPQYKISKEYIEDRKNNLLLHLKDMNVLKWVLDHAPHWHYFCHQSDAFTITSKGYIWQHDLNHTVNNKCIVPLLSMEHCMSYKHVLRDKVLYGVCSDYVSFLKDHF